ncbi:hypothetical protein CSAL01_13508 [Colletotrichum salicis]|uniref:CENP-V/GFA domain-containing protein n=1 Tax=Colletotrichum salicis TaxID=1209931 RepID=A0A135V126_9PEZI|nr:hypothetical protein CSAL01_13508 [Colletotrichum salicis]
MAVSSCLYKALEIEIQGIPMAVISGGAFGFNWVAALKDVKITGNPKTYSTKANTGNIVTSHLCSNCGVTLWRDGPPSNGLMYLKAGTLNDFKDQKLVTPVAETFVSKRLGWLGSVLGGIQKQEMQ